MAGVFRADVLAEDDVAGPFVAALPTAFFVAAFFVAAFFVVTVFPMAVFFIFQFLNRVYIQSKIAAQAKFKMVFGGIIGFSSSLNNFRFSKFKMNGNHQVVVPKF